MDKIVSTGITVIVFLLISCQGKKEDNQQMKNEVELNKQAQALAEKFIITDGHIDLPYRLKGEGYLGSDTILDLTQETSGNFDYPKSKRGGLDAPFMSIFIPAALQKTGGSKALADSLIDLVEKICVDYSDQFALANTPKEVQENFNKGKISLPMGMENGSPLEGNLSNVKHFFDRGIRYITLTHAKDNHICDSSYDTTRTWNGLSDFGKTVIKEMNKEGIMIDVSHISDDTFYQVMELSDAPCIASHSSCRKFTPGFERNMDDDMIRLLAKNDGVIQINFGSTFISQQSQEKFKKVRAYADSIANSESNSGISVDEMINAYANKIGAFASVSDVADHIDHVVSLVGIDYVGLGSDYDGVGDSLPIGLKDASTYPNLIKELLARGYTEADIEKICYKNVFRVWNKVLEIAGKQ